MLFTFKVLETDDDKFFEAFNMREALVHQSAHLQHTATQTITSLMAFVLRKEQTTGRLSNKELSLLYEQFAKYATGSEKVVETWINAARLVWERLLKDPAAYAIAMEVEEEHGAQSP